MVAHAEALSRLSSHEARPARIKSSLLQSITFVLEIRTSLSGTHLKYLQTVSICTYFSHEFLLQVQIFGKFFIGWREEARTSKKLKSLITQFFKICIQRLRLTPQACMAFFNVSALCFFFVACRCSESFVELA